MRWNYEKLDENMETQYLPTNDPDGSITGRIVMNVPAWMDENPEERKRLGWIKHIEYDDKEIMAMYPHNPQTQVLVQSVRVLDDYTIEDTYRVIDKSEEMMRLEELMQSMAPMITFGAVIYDAQGGVRI